MPATAADQITLGTRYRTILTQIAQQLFPGNGNVTSVKLPKTFLHRKILFQLRGNIIVTVATATSNFPESPLGLIKKIELLGDGRKTYWAVSGRDAYRLNAFLSGQPGALKAPLLTVGTNPFSAAFEIWHAAQAFRQPTDSFFDPRRHEDVELRITWGSPTDIVTAGPATVVIDPNNTFVDMILEQTTEGAESILFNRLINFREDTITASNSAFTYEVARSGILVGILFRTDQNTVPINNMINKITLRSDSSFIHCDGLRFDALQKMNFIDFHQERPMSAAGATGYSSTYDPATAFDSIDGYAFLPLAEDGMLSSGLNTLALNTLEVILDISFISGTQILRSTFVFFEPRDAA